MTADPTTNRAAQFRHQTYSASRPTVPHHLLSPATLPHPGSEDFECRMQRVGASLQRDNVAAIYLVHGTFVGTDALGVLGDLARIFPSASQSVQRIIKRVIERIAGEAGNYSRAYARCFETSMRCEGQLGIPVHNFHWSSENHHIGRADGAIRLIAELAALKLEPSQRVLLWGHSHAGNVFALLSNLLAGNRQAVDEFFEATAIYYRWPIVGCVDIPVWERVRELLCKTPPALADIPIDMVTFGTPIRYGWDSRGYSRLLHFVHHRLAEGVPAYRAAFPPQLDDVLNATDGDYIQQLGIAGTNIMPSVFSWRAWMADQRLNRLLQEEDSSERSVVKRLEAGAIVPDEGTTLLVDYGRQEGTIAQHHAGHAVYTYKKWLLFHAEEVAGRFYNARCQAA